MKQTSNNNQLLRVAFVDLSQAEWVAGAHYLKNLFIALKSLDQSQYPEIALLQLAQTQPGDNSSLSAYADQLLKQPALSVWQRIILRFQRQSGLRVGPKPQLMSLLHTHQIGALFSTTEFGPHFDLPLLAWIPDFQHLHFPHLFSKERIKTRNRSYSRIARYADRIILSSRNARQDFEQFAPNAAHKARVLSFVSQAPANVYESDPAWVCDKYNLPKKFFYLPNQFWKHKNHQIVVKALSLIKAKYPEITVVCTGNVKDTRNPHYFPQLSATISAEGLSDKFIILGMIPYEHIFQLTRQSLAVLQPSLFEGWSTTVEETKSIGKQIILSDIPVHREQAPSQAYFFDPHNPNVLAECLVKIFDEKEPGPDNELEALAREQLSVRTREFGQAFIKILRELIPVSPNLITLGQHVSDTTF